MKNGYIVCILLTACLTLTGCEGGGGSDDSSDSTTNTEVFASSSEHKTMIEVLNSSDYKITFSDGYQEQTLTPWKKVKMESRYLAPGQYQSITVIIFDTTGKEIFHSGEYKFFLKDELQTLTILGPGNIVQG